MRRGGSVAGLLLALSVLAPRLGWGQTGGASVTGQVEDAGGLAVAGATVTARNVLNGRQLQTQTGRDGRFALLAVAPGDYVLAASAPGESSTPARVRVRAGAAQSVGRLRLQLAGVRQTVVVSASRVAELQDDAPRAVAVLTRRQIQETGYASVGQALSEVAGVNTRAASHGVGLAAGEQIEGMDAKETQVLRDGLPIAGARGITEGILDLNQLDVGALQRIEVVKGAASALYGSDALGGVINLITRQPQQPITISASADGGSLGAVNTSLLLGSRRGRLSALVDLNHNQRQGYALLPGDASTVGANEDRRSGLVKLDFALAPQTSLGFTANAAHTQSLGLQALGLGQATSLHQNNSIQSGALVFRTVLNALTSVQARAYQSSFDENAYSAFAATPAARFDAGSLHERYRRADATLSRQWGRRQFRQFLEGGYEWATDTYRGDNRLAGGAVGQSLTTQDLWLQDRIEVGRNLLVTAGARGQHHSVYGNHGVPKLGAVYRLGEHWSLRGAYGQGFRAPDLGDLYYRLLHLEYGYQVLGNPTLRPETSQSVSAGAVFASSRFRITANVFQNRLHNLIQATLVCDATAGQDCSGAALAGLLAASGVPSSFDFDASGAAWFTYVNENVGGALTQGADISVRAVLTPALRVSGSTSYLDALDTSDHTPLPNRSRHRGHLELRFAPGRGFTANLRGDFTGAWFTGAAPGAQAFGYQVWSVYTAQQLAPGVEIFGTVNNLGNSRDRKLSLPQPSFDRPDYGRTLQLGLRFEFPARH